MEAITTREAAKILESDSTEALSLLKAANIPHRGIKSGGRVHQYLWDAEAVRKFKKVLEKRTEGGQQ